MRYRLKGFRLWTELCEGTICVYYEFIHWIGRF